MKTAKEMCIILLGAEAHFRDLATDFQDRPDDAKKMQDINELADAVLCGAIALQKAEHDFQFDNEALARWLTAGIEASRKVCG